MKRTLHVEKPLFLQEKSAIDIFELLQTKAWSVLLDTCQNTLSDGRFDILTAEPVTTIEFKNKRLKINAQEYFPSNACPFEAVDEHLLKFSRNLNFNTPQLSEVSECEFLQLPFLVGALGFAGYDLNTHTDNIKDKDIDEHHQYLSEDFAFAIYDESIVVDNQTNAVYYCHTGNNKLYNLIKHSKQVKDKSFRLTSAWQSDVNSHQYSGNIDKIQNYLIAGDCYQINYAQRFTATYQGSDWLAYKILRNVNKAPFSSFIRHSQYSIMSHSPERFLKIKNREVETKPIKGTSPRGKTAAEDKSLRARLLTSEKDKAENLMIVDLLRNDLSKHCQPHSVDVPALFNIESYPAVHHLVSTVTGKLKSESTPLMLLKGAFPGGSITGVPKIRAMQIIEELENYKRSIYCGTIGYIGVRGDMDTSVCIRTLLAEKDRLYCWAGGGIVLDSLATSEFQESLDKVSKILPILQEYKKTNTDDPK